jgi:SH3-like domain-containing protein
MRHLAFIAAMVALVAAEGAALAADAKKTMPYYGSVAAGRARMRTGPARSYPASWLYQRPDLPVRVLAAFKEWRKVEDPDGTQGWMQANLLSDTRTAMVVGQFAELKDTPRAGGRVQWRAAPGVVGRVSKCKSGWCYFDARGRGGYVETRSLWGVAADEALN